MTGTVQQGLVVAMYHYVRPTSATLPLHVMTPGTFQEHVRQLGAHYELATLESAMAWARGTYKPSRDLCLLTFDDGLREHWDIVVPVLNEARVQGIFFLTTAALEGSVLAVHKNHLLLAALGTHEYRERLVRTCAALDPTADLHVDAERAQATYRWDDTETGQLKYLVNFVLPVALAASALALLFADTFGDESHMVEALYVNWAEAREMQAAGMVLGGHSHQHVPLSRLSPAAQAGDIARCARLLEQNLAPQPQWPFSYPYGRGLSFDASSDAQVRGRFSCAFTTERGVNLAPADLYALRRLDPKEIEARW